jgi:hypothetical protein
MLHMGFLLPIPDVHSAHCLINLIPTLIKNLGPCSPILASDALKQVVNVEDVLAGKKELPKKAATTTHFT